MFKSILQKDFVPNISTENAKKKLDSVEKDFKTKHMCLYFLISTVHSFLFHKQLVLIVVFSARQKNNKYSLTIKIHI